MAFLALCVDCGPVLCSVRQELLCGVDLLRRLPGRVLLFAGVGGGSSVWDMFEL